MTQDRCVTPAAFRRAPTDRLRAAADSGPWKPPSYRAERGLTVAIDVPPRRISEIVHGKRRMSADTALRLSRFFGTSERFW